MLEFKDVIVWIFVVICCVCKKCGIFVVSGE